MNNIIAKSVQNGYPAAVAAPCIIGGKLYCLRNDVAPDVLWYNAKLMKQWGYTVPTTYPQYQALGVKIGKEHPGYYVAMLGDTYAVERYLWGANCPTNDLIGPKKVLIDLNASSCTGSRACSTPSSWPRWPPGRYLRHRRGEDRLQAGHDTAQPGTASTCSRTPSRFRRARSWRRPAAVAGHDGRHGDEGGGLWSMSSHISGQRRTDTALFMQFMAANPKWQVALTTGLPAYRPDDAAWINRNIVKSGYFADPAQIGPAMLKAADEIRPNDEYLLYDEGALWTDTVTPVLAAGKPISAAWSAYQNELVNNAKLNGYTVVTH